MSYINKTETLRGLQEKKKYQIETKHFSHLRGRKREMLNDRGIESCKLGL